MGGTELPNVPPVLQQVMCWQDLEASHSHKCPKDTVIGLQELARKVRVGKCKPWRDGGSFHIGTMRKGRGSGIMFFRLFWQLTATRQAGGVQTTQES